MLGYSQEECIGSIMEDIGFTFHEGYFQELLPILDKEGIVYSKDLPVLTKDNQTVDTDIYMVDKAALIQCNIRDITIKKQQAFEREQMFAAIEQAGEGIAITSPDGIIKYINPAFESITGYSKEETIGKNPDFLKSGLQDQKFYKNLWDTILSGSRWTGRLINNRKDGTAYTSECSISPIKDLEGNLLNFIWISKDITKEMALEKRIEQAQRMESIGILAGGIAHDFNNILSVIIGYTELAHDEVEKDSTIEEYLKEIHIGGIRAKTLVMQILGFARQSDETISPHRIDVIAKEVLKFIRSSIPATIEIQSDIQSDSLIMGNPTQVHQIFMNLCTNSAHAMKEKGGILKISLNDIETDKNLKVQDVGLKQGSYIQINVSDTGIGIPPDLLGRIFEPYFTTKPLEEGTGLGLALIHGIVESYGGKTIVESGLGKGTVFTIYLPITQKRKKVKFFSRKELPSGTESILLVDDEAPILKIEEKTLEHFGYSVTTSLSSVDALELFRSNPNRFDLVITDMTMPKMNGDKLAAALIKIRPDIPIVLFSGYSQKMSGKDITDIGIKAFVSKPVSKETMAKTVRKVLDEAKKPAQE
jgi:PAS domain S-box-containing protein